MNMKKYKIVVLVIIIFNVFIGCFYCFHPDIIYNTGYNKIFYLLNLILIAPLGYPFMGFLLNKFIESSFKGFAAKYMYFMVLVMSVGSALASIYYVYNSIINLTDENLLYSSMFFTFSLSLIFGYRNKKK